VPYTAQRPAVASADDLRARIPGWGADLDPADRPSHPKMRFDPQGTGAHWKYPEMQRDVSGRERSLEHAHLTPVFGTSTPLRGLSGTVRRLAYRRYSEGRAAHWLLLVAGDRIDTVESHLRSLISLRPDNPITETGVLSELRRRPIASRFGRRRADLRHLWLDPIIVAGPWIATIVAAVAGLRSLRARVRT
jgi:hypothetical protein